MRVGGGSLVRRWRHATRGRVRVLVGLYERKTGPEKERKKHVIVDNSYRKRAKVAKR